MQRTSTILVSLALTLLATSATATTCREDACDVGQHVTTYSAPGEPVAICATDALAAYSNFMLYLVAADAASTQQATVDPNAVEAKATGDSVDVLKRLREASGIASANEALKACSPLKAGASVVVLELSKKTNNAKVSGTNGEAAFWIPTGFLER
ncbi:MAG: hypothetical protein WBW32_00970 [Luteibacter sp.]